MEDQNLDEDIAVYKRLHVLFSECSDGTEHHRWNLDLGKCEKCGKEWPYKDETNPQ